MIPEAFELSTHLLESLQTSISIRKQLQSLKISERLQTLANYPSSRATSLDGASGDAVVLPAADNAQNGTATMDQDDDATASAADLPDVPLAIFFELLQDTDPKDRTAMFSGLFRGLLRGGEAEGLSRALNLLPLLTISQIRLSPATITHLIQKCCSSRDPGPLARVFGYCKSLGIRIPGSAYGSIVLWDCARPSILNAAPITRAGEGDRLFRLNSIIEGALDHRSGPSSPEGLDLRQISIHNRLAQGLVEQAWADFYATQLLGEEGHLPARVIAELASHVRSAQDLQALCSHPAAGAEVLIRVLQSPWAQSIGGPSKRVVFQLLMLKGWGHTATPKLADFFHHVSPAELPWLLANANLINDPLLRGILTTIHGLGLVRECADFERLLVEQDQPREAFAVLLKHWLLSPATNPCMSIHLWNALIPNARFLRDSELDWSRLGDVVREAVSGGLGDDLHPLLDLLCTLIQQGRARVLGLRGWNLVFRELYNRGNLHASQTLLKMVAREPSVPQGSRVFAEMLLTHEPAKAARRWREQIVKDTVQGEIVVSTTLHCLIRRLCYKEAVDLVRQIEPSRLTAYLLALGLQAAALSGSLSLVACMRREIARSEWNNLFTTTHKIILTMEDAPCDIVDSRDQRAVGLATLLAHHQGSDVCQFAEAFFRLFSGSLRPDLDCARVYLQVEARSRRVQDPEFGARFLDWLGRRSAVPLDQSIYARLLHLAASSKDESLLAHMLIVIHHGWLKLTLPIVNQLFKCLSSFGAAHERFAQVARSAQEASISLGNTHFECLIESASQESNVDAAMEWCRRSILLDRPAKAELVSRLTSQVLQTRRLSDCLDWLAFLEKARVTLSRPVMERALWLCLNSHKWVATKGIYGFCRRQRIVPGKRVTEAILEAALAAGDLNFAVKVWNDICRNQRPMFPDLASMGAFLDRYATPLLARVPELASRLDSLVPGCGREWGGSAEVLQWAFSHRVSLSSRFCWDAIVRALLDGDLAVAQRFHLYIVTNGLDLESKVGDRALRRLLGGAWPGSGGGGISIAG